MTTKKLCDSPVTRRLKDGARGNGDWLGFDHVYQNLAAACEKMAQSQSYYLSDAHVDTMADLGSGNEERMKYRQMWLREYGWLA